MEVIHRYNGTYPFFLDYETEHTYLEVIKENLTQDQIALEKAKLKILKEMDQSNLVRLVKIYREEATLHLLYDYFPISLEKYVQERRKIPTKNQRNETSLLYQHFAATIDAIIARFIDTQIKTDISIHNMAVSSL